MSHSSKLATTFLVFVLFSFDANAACVSYPKSNDRAQWQDLEHLTVERELNSLIEDVQNIASMGHGNINTDVYAITVDANGDTPASLFEWFRANLDDMLFAGTTYGLSPYDDENDTKWNSGNPQGAVMTFTLAGIEGVLSFRGSVVVSCKSSTDMIFSTVKTEKDGYHPVAGNRAFGIVSEPDGGLTIFVKAADRIVDSSIFGIDSEVLREVIFDQGHQVWLRMLDTLERTLSGRNPRNRFVFSVRRPYEEE